MRAVGALDRAELSADIGGRRSASRYRSTVSGIQIDSHEPVQLILPFISWSGE